MPIVAGRYRQGAALTSQAAGSCAELVPHDTDEILNMTAGIRVNVSGLVKLRFAGDNVAVTLYLIAGVDYPYQIQQVYIVGTDAAVLTGKVFGLY